MIPFSWTRVEMGWSKDQCPPDLTLVASGEKCARAHPWGYTCTRRMDHGGRHAAGAGVCIVAVWP